MQIDYKQLEFIHPTLRAIMADLEDSTGLEFTITSLYRIGDPGVHGQMPLRGVDLRIHQQDLGHYLAELINTAYQYDPDRPHMDVAKAHGPNFHLHLQVQPNTVER